jgi:RHS repeat-associated protein
VGSERRWLCVRCPGPDQFSTDLGAHRGLLWTCALRGPNLGGSYDSIFPIGTFHRHNQRVLSARSLVECKSHFKRCRRDPRSRRFDPFGRADNVSVADQDVSFASLRNSDDGSLNYDAAYRRYSPSSGRWLSEDPMGFTSGSSNWYAYADSQILTAIDPSGLVAWDVDTKITEVITTMPGAAAACKAANPLCCCTTSKWGAGGKCNCVNGAYKMETVGLFDCVRSWDAPGRVIDYRCCRSTAPDAVSCDWRLCSSRRDSRVGLRASKPRHLRAQSTHR